ncbi:MAG: RNA-guided endonuclease InsQ/TnpB family protein [Candidatus Thorarchaeota archaeon]
MQRLSSAPLVKYSLTYVVNICKGTTLTSMLRTYRYRMYPSKRQRELIRKNIDACRYVYNWALENKKRAYENEKKSLSWFELNKMLRELKVEEPWLKDAYSQSLQMSIRRVDLAFKHFYRRVRNGETPGFPKFKSKRNLSRSFDIPQFFVAEFSKMRVKIPKIGYIKTVFHREYTGQAKQSVIKIEKSGQIYINIFVEQIAEYSEPPEVNEGNTVGLDLGIASYAILSNGEKIDNPKHLEVSLKRLKVLQRKLSRKKKGSNNHEKARLQVAKLHDKIKNQRRDFQHKLSTRLVCENQGITVESLNVSGMIRNPMLSRRIADAGWAAFIMMLDYKSRCNGVALIRVGRFEPTSKLCSKCDSKNDNLTLSDRNWTCPVCKTTLDRDLNAALNIKRLGLELNTPQELGEEPVDLSLWEGLKQEAVDLG